MTHIGEPLEEPFVEILPAEDPIGTPEREPELVPAGPDRESDDGAGA